MSGGHYSYKFFHTEYLAEELEEEEELEVVRHIAWAEAWQRHARPVDA